MDGAVRMWACWVGRLVGWRLEVGGPRSEAGGRLVLGWVKLEADSKQRQRSLFISSFFTSQSPAAVGREAGK